MTSAAVARSKHPQGLTLPQRLTLLYLQLLSFAPLCQTPTTASAELLGSIPKDMQTLALELTNHTHLLSDYFVLQHYLDRCVSLLAASFLPFSSLALCRLPFSRYLLRQPSKLTGNHLIVVGSLASSGVTRRIVSNRSGPLTSLFFLLSHTPFYSVVPRTVLPAALELCGKIQSEDKSMADWALSYAKTMRALRDKLLLAAQDQSNLDNQELSGLLGSVAPALKSTPDIAQQVRVRVYTESHVSLAHVLGFSRSTPVRPFARSCLACTVNTLPADAGEAIAYLTCNTQLCCFR